MTSGSRFGRLSMIAAVLTFIVAFTAHALLIRKYGVEVPFWDQWSAEGVRVLKPWAEGHLTWEAMVAPWNEHRILFTRLVSLAMYQLTGGHWSIVATEYVNAVIFATTPALLVLLLAYSGMPQKNKAWMTLFVVAFAVLPHGWENTIAAFQSQFYFMLLFTVAGLGMSAFRRPGPSHTVLLAVTAIAANFTMAPGILVGPAICAVLVGRVWTGTYPWRPALVTILVLAGVFVTSYLTTPKIEAHMALHAQGLRELTRSVAIVASWPTASPGIGAIILWIPSMVAAWFILRRSWSDRFDIFILGMAAWAAAQIVGIAYSRGHDMQSVTPRYTDVLVLGVLSNAWFAIRLASAFPRQAAVKQVIAAAPLALLMLVVARGYIASWDVTQAQMIARRDSGLMQQAHIQAYLETGIPEEINQPGEALPYPDPVGFKILLDDPVIRSMLVKASPEARQERSNP